MPAAYIASALVPAFSEEAIRSTYLYILGKQGSTNAVVIVTAFIFVVGEFDYGFSLFGDAQSELGTSVALTLLGGALVSGATLHIALTFWTARNQMRGVGVWRVFALAFVAHSLFNLLALKLMELWV